MTNLLKKGQLWEWTIGRQATFNHLKRVMIEEPVLALPNYHKAFEVETDASNFAISGVLMQDEHPVAYESRKLNEAERRYTVQEKEMTVVVRCLRMWRHYLLGSWIVVRTDKIATGLLSDSKEVVTKVGSVAGFPC